nr:sulfate transporter 1.3-like [Ipomoea batatas]
MSKRVADEAVGAAVESGHITREPSSRRLSEAALPYIHKVEKPPKQGWLEELKWTVKETFFHDEPLRHFKDQPRSRKFMLALQAVCPIFDWGRSYDLSKFKGDLISGLTIASLCIPQDIGYSGLANLDPQYGLFQGILQIGPVAVVSLLLGSLLRDEIDPELHKWEYHRLAFTAHFLRRRHSVFCLVFSGFLIDFLSHAAIVGFMAGAAITIALQQLKGLLGIRKFTKKTDIISVMHSVWGSVHHGVRLERRTRSTFWVPAIAPLISVVISTFFVFITHADKHGVQIVNHIKKGINPASADQIYFSGEYLTKGIRIGVVAGMIALTVIKPKLYILIIHISSAHCGAYYVDVRNLWDDDLQEAAAIGRTFAAMKDYQLDGNKEMIALGSMNIVGSMTSCYVATGSFSRSAVNYMAGCHTTVSNIVMSCVVMLTLLLITPLFKYTPNAILASIIISAVVGLIDIDAMILLWKIDKFDFITSMGAFFGVVFHSVEIGLLIAVAISFAKILLQVTRPRIAVLGKIPRSAIYRNVLQYPDATKLPGILILRVDSAIYFSNCNYVRDRALLWLSDEEDKLKENNGTKIQLMIIDLSPVIDIDTGGIHAVEDLHKSLEKRHVQLILANPGHKVMDKLHTSGLANVIGEDKIFLTVADAVTALAPKMEP